MSADKPQDFEQNVIDVEKTFQDKSIQDDAVPSKMKSRKWIVIAGCAFVLLLVLAAIVMSRRGGSNPTNLGESNANLPGFGGLKHQEEADSTQSAIDVLLDTNKFGTPFVNWKTVLLERVQISSFSMSDDETRAMAMWDTNPSEGLRILMEEAKKKKKGSLLHAMIGLFYERYFMESHWIYDSDAGVLDLSGKDLFFVSLLDVNDLRYTKLILTLQKLPENFFRTIVHGMLLFLAIKPGDSLVHFNMMVPIFKKVVEGKECLLRGSEQLDDEYWKTENPAPEFMDLIRYLREKATAAVTAIDRSDSEDGADEE